MARPDQRGPFGEDPVRETVRFVGGPWDGDAGRYYGLFEYPDMVTPGGRYRLERADHERREVTYVFHHDAAPAL
jgi:hypothetical protein